MTDPIVVRTKGVPLKREVGKDAEGFDVFTLVEPKHDGMNVLLATLAKCNYPNIGGGDPRLDLVQWSTSVGCAGRICATSDQCHHLRACALKV
jgi:hypothetical protein